MNRQDIYAYYSREDVINELLNTAKNREIVGAYWDGTFDKRPNILQYKNDIVQMARKGVTSFHFSVEHWSNPMAINKDNYNKLRTGWDIIIDIDSKLGIDEAKLTTEMIIKLLEKYGIKNYGIKFSGRRGFHISLPWAMFPDEVDYKKLAAMYPKVPRIISRFIRKKISMDLMKELIRRKGAKELIEAIGEAPDRMNPFYFVEVEKDWGSRHMFRAPFSLNEKTWLASLPLKFSQLKGFKPDDAKPDKIKVSTGFFQGEKNEAVDLLTDAMDWYASIKKEPEKKQKIKINWEKKVAEEYFPPCIKLIMSGLSDGRKRSIFTLSNFLRMMNWNWEEIEEKINKTNENNRPSLNRNEILSRLRWNEQNQMSPANCDSALFYIDTRICRSDEICKQGTAAIKIKNPMAYPFWKMKKERMTKPRIRGFSCGICNKEFKTMRSLNYHKTRVH